MKQRNTGDLLKQVTRMRREIDKVQGELKERYLEASTGGGLVTVTMNGAQELVKVSIAPGAVEKNAEGGLDVDLLEDLIVAAVNQGLEKSRALMNEEMSKATGGLSENFPGLF